MRALNPRIPRLAALLPLLAGCTGPAATGPAAPAPWSGPCVVAPRNAGDRAPSPTGGPVEVAVPAPLPPADGPSSDAGARVVLRQLYETLVEVDCEGNVRPGLAASWSHDDEGRRWRFTLRPDGRFWNDAPVTAEAVARSWLSSLGSAVPRQGLPRVLRASVTGPLELTVTLRDPTRAAERFARPSTSVTGEGRSGGWPMGSGPYRPTTRVSPRGSVEVVAASVDGGRALTFMAEPGGDGRAALDAGADVLVTADPAVLAYARALPGLTVTPLPWSRTYVLAAGEGDVWARQVPPTAPVEALEGLARGAVRAEARPARQPYWWREGGCGEETLAGDVEHLERVMAAGGDVAAPARIAYPLGDPVARGIAERLVALGGRGDAIPAWLVTAVAGVASTEGPVVAAALDPAALARAVRRGEALAFVLPVPLAPGGACTSALLAAEDPVARVLFAPDAGLRITPLVDVRPSLVLRRGIGGVALDGDGTLRFLPEGAAPGGGRRP